MGSRTKNATRNIFWGLISNIITLGMPFITRTVMICTLGMNFVGLGSLFTSILQVLSFAELGIGGALVFSMYKPIAEQDDEKVCALLAFYRRAYRIIGTVILIVGIVMLPFLKYLIKGDLPQGSNLYVLYSLYLLNNLIGYFLFAYKQSLFTASQRIDYISKIGMGLNLLSNVSQIIILLFTKNYYLYVAVIPIFTCVTNIIIGVVTDRVFPQYKCRGKIDKEELFTIKEKIGGMVFQKIGSIVLISVDSIVISAFLGLIPLGIYQNYYYIITAIFGILTILMQSIVASVGNSIASESIEKNYEDFKLFNLMYIWIIVFCSTCLLCLYQPFMKIWVGTERMFGLEMVILFVVYFFVHKWCDMLYVYQEACGIWWETKFVPLLAAITNLVINIALVNLIGLPGILISTIIAVIFVYDIGYARVLFKTYFKPLNELKNYWIRQSFYFFTMIVAAVCTYGICNIIPISSNVLRLIINAGICVIIPNLIVFLLWNKLPEFKRAIGMAKKIFAQK